MTKQHFECPLENLESMADADLSFSIAYFKDEGWTIKLADEGGSYVAGYWCEDLGEGILWLWQRAQKHYPDANCFGGF